MRVENTCSIVTGGSKGIGKSIVELIVSKGGNVIIGDILDKEGQELAESMNKSGKKRVVFVHCDVTKLEELKNLFKVADEEFGGAQILFNNAGIDEPWYPYNDLERSIRLFQINLGAVYIGSLLAQEHFNNQLRSDPNKQFCIINTGSTSARDIVRELPYYSFTKNSVMSITHIISELNWKNTRVNCLAPTFTRTDVLKSGDTDDTELIESTLGLLEPEYVAEKMLELIEDDTCNGVVKFVDVDRDEVANKPNFISFNEKIGEFLANSNNGEKE
ncbi:NAD(P)-binding protein [Conidiobolus coronatus NRRL 28638]|uniref:NAD(P)-binding protein n=1 Tax=Conidiobolus coronatus (strain ATCC 28846 / CBS 209.66 / NRRL 28638) TaxID=796925 RepID=A0A137P8X2_CONC2|nr:NAD(P)-binding protein [Conidiobolus coronatus NRRL 28638]|eukprot:KXN71381.1 NAD(P)-binding protein [Conidiobolus coronatus NRRL 28638]